MTGQTVSHYRILEKLGAGGMGIVYKAQDLKLDRLVALKFLPPALSADEEQKKNFLLEARAASALDHSNIGVIYDVDETAEGQMFIVMAFHPGETLKSRLARGLRIAEALDIARQIALGLAKAHGQGIVHRDIKPTNVMITSEGAVKIIDFGLAKVADVTVTLEGIAKGTVAYMSPEQARGQTVDARTDIWSLGVVLYETIAGRLPFPSGHPSVVLNAIIHEAPHQLHELRPEAPQEVERIVAKALEKDRNRRYASAAELAEDLSKCLTEITSGRVRLGPRRRWPKWAMAGAAAAAILLGAWFYHASTKVRWAREAKPRIVSLAAQGHFVQAFLLAGEVAPWLRGDPAMNKLWDDISREVSIATQPPGAEIELKEYARPGDPWIRIGTSPIARVRVPLGLLRWRATKPGFAPVYEAHTPFRTGGRIVYDLAAEGAVPAGMVRVPGGDIGYTVAFLGTVAASNTTPYFIDRYEVTNKQYKAFVDAGGYRKPEHWKQPFVRNGRTIPWAEAMAEFHDSTGQPGPSTWEAGTYLAGQDDYPVSGVSWFEAAAFSSFAGKDLPTIAHWYRAADPNTGLYVIPLSNFGSAGPAPAGEYQGMSAQGAFDMVGNVKEWCWNEAGPDLRYILGGAWREPTYQFYQPDAQSPWDRSATNGFRTVRYTEAPPAAVLGPKPRAFRDYSKEKPVSDEVFAVFRGIYAYDRGELNAKTEAVDDGSEFWRKEKVSYDEPGGGGRMPAILFLPKQGKPPFQTVVYFPSAAALSYASRDTLEGVGRWSFLPKSGRAVLYPIYTGTFERRATAPLSVIQNRDRMIQMSKEVRRSIDYLQTRADIDHERIAYMGASFGAAYSPIFAAFEDRLKAYILQDGGFFFNKRPPETDQLNFVPRLRAPALLLSGRYDFTFPHETSQLPFFRLLGAAANDKRHVVFDTAHDVSIMRSEMIREVLNWLDRYLGKV